VLSQSRRVISVHYRPHEFVHAVLQMVLALIDAQIAEATLGPSPQSFNGVVFAGVSSVENKFDV
jgi:hypothetical protein